MFEKEYSLAFAWCLLCFSFGCKDTPPEPPKPVAKDPRTYTWTVDTLKYPNSFQTLMYDMWGSSPDNVYAVGYADGSRGVIWHFNGRQWQPVSTPYGVFLNGIWGLGPNNIIAVGARYYQNPITLESSDSSAILQFDGTTWREVRIVRSRYLWSVFGSSPSDVWAGGGAGSLYHFNGAAWSRVSFFDSTLFIGSISGRSPSEQYGIAIRRDEVQPLDTSSYFFCRFNGTTWQAVDSFMITPPFFTYAFGWSLWTTPAGRMYSVGTGVHLRQGSSWHQEFYTGSLRKMRGSSDKNILAVGDHDRLFHWNGNDWKQIHISNSDLILISASVFDNEAFVLGGDARYSYIFHGK
jgi:hypothetical protein